MAWAKKDDDEDRLMRARRQRNLWKLFGGVVGSALGLLVVMLVLSMSWGEVLSPKVFFEHAQSKGMLLVLASMAEVMAAVLGLSLTVVAIVVQLASQRYPAKIVDLFMTDATNLTVFGFMASSCIYMVLAPVFVMEGTSWVAIVALLLAVLNFGVLLPYFGHVFAFLDPHSIITRIKTKAGDAIVEVAVQGLSVGPRQKELAQAIDRIADNSMAAVGQYDRNLTMHTVSTLEELVCSYLELKGELPNAWALIEADYLSTLSREFLDEILTNKAWVEAKTLMEFDRLFRQGLGHMDELVSQVAVSTRAIGERALHAGDDEVLALTVRFFNTYIRHTLNAKKVRAAYNVLYEYRLFAEHMLKRRPDMGSKIVRYMVYYGRTANTMGLPFVTVTAAHDVRALCQVAYTHEGVDMRTMLQFFLSLDQPSDELDSNSEVALLGVRRAQSILGGFFLREGNEEFVEQIRFDMREEPVGRMTAIRNAILSVDEHKFWEITDRGFNFDYVEPEHHAYITEFFAPMLTTQPPRALSKTS